jgi:ubiquinone/menaquinone biosynthesis C-methylase UbiE
VPELDPVILSFYQQGKEEDRLSSLHHPSGPLEFLRTQELILRFLPERSLRILDIGGGPGAYAQWLTDLGHQVTLCDPVPLHVAQASAKGLSAHLGDARELNEPSESVDVVLLLGPLYHLVNRSDRLQALREATRLVRPGGLVFVAAISRFAALLDLMVRLDKFEEEGVAPLVIECVETGVMDGTENRLFTSAYMHRPSELRAEAEEAGLTSLRLFNIEGPGFMVHNFADRWTDPVRRESLLQAARLVEEDPDLLAAAGHLLLVGRKEADY